MVSKPIRIRSKGTEALEAVQFDGTEGSIAAAKQWDCGISEYSNGHFVLRYKESYYPMFVGYWAIRDDRLNVFVCGPESFEARYERAE